MLPGNESHRAKEVFFASTGSEWRAQNRLREEKESEMTRVLLCSGDPVLVDGLCNSRLELEDSTFVSCQGEARLPAALAFHRPDVIFLDLPEELVAGSIGMLQDLTPSSHIVLRVRSASSQFATKAIASGVRGVILEFKGRCDRVARLNAVAVANADGWTGWTARNNDRRDDHENGDHSHTGEDRPHSHVPTA